MALIFARQRVIVCMLFLLTISPMAMPTGANSQATAISPVLTSALAMTSQPNFLVVTGEGFTPGGQVFLVLYDQWGAELHDTYWTTANANQFGINGSQDPAQGYQEGGAILKEVASFSQTVYGPNGSQDPAQGFSRDNRVAHVVDHNATTVYGPNGSQDPAQGFMQVEATRSIVYTCEASAMVRAYDQNAQLWSNVVDVKAQCSA